MDNKEFFLKQLDGIINEYIDLRSKSKHSDLSDRDNSIDMSSLLAKSIASIERIAGKNSEYYKSIQIAFNDKHQYFNQGTILTHIIGIVTALKNDMSNNFLKSIAEIIHSEVFFDYLEMADYLLKEGYKDAAAVIVGSTLESHLRKLCLKNSIEIEYVNNKETIVSKKAESLNSELSKAEVYTKTFQKQITAWLNLRNNAAHGHYDEYNIEEIKLMISGIMNFMITYSA
jgi:hypothetical protein